MVVSEEYKIRKKVVKKIEMDIPSDVNLNIEGRNIIFEKSGNKNTVIYNDVYLYPEYDNKSHKLFLNPKDSRKRTRAILHATQKHILNAIKGLNEEFIYKLKIVYSHFPISVKTEGNFVLINNFLGEKKPRKTKILSGCSVEVKGKDIIVKGHNKYNTGQTAGNIEKITRITNKDFRVFDDGCYIVEKPHTH
jgi:large subunit ribosomal protein L6